MPAWLLVGPVWLATGLLTPITLAYPAQVVARLVRGRPSATTESGDPFLAEWVFGVVYTGFIVQGLALGALFALYARQRWSYVWVGRLADLPRAVRPQHVAAVGIAALTTFALTMHLLWASGAQSDGPTPVRPTGRGTTTSSRRRSPSWRSPPRSASWSGFSDGVPGAGLAAPRSRHRRVGGPRGLGRLLLVVSAVNTDAAKQTTSLMSVTYFAQVTLGAWSLAWAVGFARERRRARALLMHPAGGSFVLRWARLEERRRPAGGAAAYSRQVRVPGEE